MQKHSRGFTLVELSIVLVILGLLIGGVLTGQSLIRAAQLRAVTNEQSRYITALGTFRDKYFALPGDMPNAVRYWGAQAGSTADGVDSTCAALTTAASGAITCNGNGDGILARSGSLYESFRAWQQLANAGLVEGSYSGVLGTGGVTQPGTNIAASRYPSGGWEFFGLGAGAYNGNYYSANYGNSMFFGANSSTAYQQGTILRAEDAYNIDTKVDDGKPQSGKVLSYNYNYSPHCVISTDDAYALPDQTIGCALIFITGY